MKINLILLLLIIVITCEAQKVDNTFDASISNPKYSKGNGPNVLFDAGHHNFVIEMGAINALADLARSDGYQIKIDSMRFTNAYLSDYRIIVIMPAMPFKFGSKKEVTDEITFQQEELNALYDWVNKGGSLLMLSEHAPIDRSMTPLFNKFGIKLSIGIVSDSLNSDTIPKLLAYTRLKYTRNNGLLNTKHPITKGEKNNEKINNILTYGGSGLTGKAYSNILKLSNTATIKKWNGITPSGTANSQCLAGKFGKGKVVALGDCNGFTAMYFTVDEKRVQAGMQTKEYDWRQFALNTFHWLSL